MACARVDHQRAAATYIAVRQQAIQVADQWIDRLKNDDVEQAFALTIPAQYRSSDSMPRRDLEEINNRQRGEDGQGPLDVFAQKPSVRLLNRASKAQVELVSVNDWNYENGGYRILLT